jgi:hypothetical protein
MIRLQHMGEDLIGKVCVSELGRPGVITNKKQIPFKSGETEEFWVGIGFDGKGLWAHRVSTPTAVLAETLDEYCNIILNRPSNVSYATIAIEPPRN